MDLYLMDVLAVDLKGRTDWDDLLLAAGVRPCGAWDPLIRLVRAEYVETEEPFVEFVVGRPDVPVLLVGSGRTVSALTDDEGRAVLPITEEMGVCEAKAWCSSLSVVGLRANGYGVRLTYKVSL